MRSPQGARGALTVAGGDWQGCAFGHGQPGITHHLGEGAQAHDLGTQTLGHVRRCQQAEVGDLGAVGHVFLGRSTHRNQPALGFDPGG